MAKTISATNRKRRRSQATAAKKGEIERHKVAVKRSKRAKAKKIARA